MLSLKENSEALGNFSEQLDIEGRSLWQDARRRFMHKRRLRALYYFSLFYYLSFLPQCYRLLSMTIPIGR